MNSFLFLTITPTNNPVADCLWSFQTFPLWTSVLLLAGSPLFLIIPYQVLLVNDCTNVDADLCFCS